MRVKYLSLLPILFAIGVKADSQLKGSAISMHKDARKTPRLIANPSSTRIYSMQDALAFLKSQHKAFKLPATLENLVHAKTKESLLGKHYIFQQVENGVKVNEGEIIISVAHNTGRIYNIFNNTFPVDARKIRIKSAFNQDAALDIAWRSLRVHGPLLGSPTAKLEYRYLENELRLVYVTHIATEAPFGYFEQIIDARTGKILQKYDAAISRNKRETWPRAIDEYRGPVLNRRQAERAYAIKIMSTETEAPVTSASGQALVFDPDPRTALNKRDLEDDSDPALFDPAYVNGILADISFDGTNYSLKGPWVEISDFESPANAPSTTADGIWTAKRGNNAFNDVMTYYHIDKSQRYIQSLGFTGERGIQHGSIKVDSDGVGGADNSHFVPYSNQIAFGHGCVDDNEDADVILHEYGHALEDSINSSWGGGDTGAMGEGFGDYWAASYSISNEAWAGYYPHEIFSWDAHGNNSSCWPGRVLNALDARYDPEQSYGAHSGIEGGFQSDELWSTPLFQSLLELRNRGFKREEADRIILEAHFGLGGQLTMREMANNIVRVAHALYPEGPHGDIFLEKFVHHNIIDLPKAMLSLGDIGAENLGPNGFLDPGEEVKLTLPLNNIGTLVASSVKAELSTSTEGVVVLNELASYGDIDLNNQQINSTPFVIMLARDLPCGTLIDFTLKLHFGGGTINDATLKFSLPTGMPLPNPGIFNTAPNLAIPDNNLEGVVSTLSIAQSNAIIKASGLSVDLNISHTFKGDLKVTLISPQGTRVLLHNALGGSDNDIIGTYPDTLTPHENFNKLEGEALDGEWKLEVIDKAGIDTGTINSWGIKAVFDHQCEQV